MTPNTHHDADLEACSALFDGELQGDAARFALKRLGHDAQWRQACGNWQLVGDLLRGQAAALAPRDFADRVAAAIAIEPVLQAALATGAATPASANAASRRGGSRRWIGGAALAASVAVAALFVARPLSQDAAPGAESGTLAAEVSARPAATETAVPVPTPIAPDSQVGLAAAVAVAEVPRRAAERRARSRPTRVAARQVPVVVAVSSRPAVASAAPASSVPTPHPFRLPQGEITTRPWPRAVLPNYPATGALTASFGSSVAGSPSFYPFEPRLPVDEGSNAPAAPGDGPRP